MVGVGSPAFSVVQQPVQGVLVHALFPGCVVQFRLPGILGEQPVLDLQVQPVGHPVHLMLDGLLELLRILSARVGVELCLNGRRHFGDALQVPPVGPVGCVVFVHARVSGHVPQGHVAAAVYDALDVVHGILAAGVLNVVEGMLDLFPFPFQDWFRPVPVVRLAGLLVGEF